MEIERHVELLGPLIDRPELFQVEKFAVRHAVDHGALEAELGHGALELVGGGLRVDGRQRGEGGEALGVGRADLGEPVIDLPRQLGGDIDRQFLRRGRAMRKQLDVDAGLVHVFQAQLAEVVKHLVGFVAAAGLGAGEMLGKLGIPIMLFDGDDRNIRLFEHDASPVTYRAPFLATAPVPVTACPCRTRHGLVLRVSRLPQAMKMISRLYLEIRPTQLCTGYAADSSSDSGRRRIPRHSDFDPGAQSAGRSARPV